MFTGIIEEIGTIRSLCIQGSSGTIAIHAQKVLEGTMVGDSIAVNGICLTVTSIHPWGFTADVMAETIRRSALGHARTGTPVNLERAMAANGRFGGHIVSGHIDGPGVIKSIRLDGNAVWFEIRAEEKILIIFIMVYAYIFAELVCNNFCKAFSHTQGYIFCFPAEHTENGIGIFDNINVGKKISALTGNILYIVQNRSPHQVAQALINYSASA